MAQFCSIHDRNIGVVVTDPLRLNIGCLAIFFRTFIYRPPPPRFTYKVVSECASSVSDGVPATSIVSLRPLFCMKISDGDTTRVTPLAFFLECWHDARSVPCEQPKVRKMD